MQGTCLVARVRYLKFMFASRNKIGLDLNLDKFGNWINT